MDDDNDDDDNDDNDDNNNNDNDTTNYFTPWHARGVIILLMVSWCGESNSQ